MTEVDWEKLDELSAKWREALAERRAFCGAEDEDSRFVSGFKLSAFLDTEEGQNFDRVREEFGQALRLAFPTIREIQEENEGLREALNNILRFTPEMAESLANWAYTKSPHDDASGSLRRLAKNLRVGLAALKDNPQ